MATQMQVTVPAGLSEGMEFQVQLPTGETTQVTVPKGHTEGMTFPFQVPNAQPQTVPVTVVTAATPVVAAAPVAPVAPVVYQNVAVSVDGVPPGAPPGGTWTSEQFTGTITIIIAVVLLFLFWPVMCVPFCCPCESRSVYIAPDGRKFVRSGAVVPPSDCCGHPCGGPTQ